MVKHNTRSIYKFYLSQGGTLSYQQYYNIVDSFHKKISARIIAGEFFEAPFNIGVFKVVLNKRKISIKDNGNIKGAINWKESNILKQQIINSGGIPFKTNEDGTNNGGEKWLVYRTDTFYPCWIRVVNVFLHNSNKYTFKPTWTNSRSMLKDEDAELTYNYIENNGTNQDYLFSRLVAENKFNLRPNDKQLVS